MEATSESSGRLQGRQLEATPTDKSYRDESFGTRTGCGVALALRKKSGGARRAPPLNALKLVLKTARELSQSIPKYPTVSRPDRRRRACRWGTLSDLSPCHRPGDRRRFFSARIPDEPRQFLPSL